MVWGCATTLRVIVLGVVGAGLASNGWAGPGGRGGRTDRAASKRYISSQAYYHAMRAELAIARGRLAAAADELQLALVYDPSSILLTLELARIKAKLGRTAKAERLVEQVLARRPRLGEALLVKASLERAAGRTRAAETSLRRALRDASVFLEASLELARLLEETGKPQDAARVLRRAAQQEPQSTAPLVALARLERRLLRMDEAARALERAADRDPADREILVELTDVYEAQARYLDAAERWTRLLEASPTDVDALMQAARVALWLGRDASADTMFERALRDGSRPELSREIGLIYAFEGRDERALELLGPYLSTHAADPEARYAHARALLSKGDHKAALAELALLGPEAPMYLEARRVSAETLLALGQVARAVLLIESTLEHHPESVAMIEMLAEVEARRGRTEAALELLREARAKHPDSDALLLREAGILRWSRGIEAALAHLDPAPNGRGTAIRLERARLLFAQADWAGAERAAAECYRADASHVPTMELLGRLWGEQPERLRDAQRMLEQALARDPSSGTVLDALGWVRWLRGDPDGALLLLRRAAGRAPQDPGVFEHLGDVLRAQNDREGAHLAYERSRALRERAIVARAPGATDAKRRLEKKLEGR